MYKDRNKRPKAFIGAAISAAAGLAKGIAGGIKQRKANKAATQQNYVQAVLQSKAAMDEELIANEGLAEQFEDKFVARFGGRKSIKKMACGGRKKAACGTRKKANTGLLQPTMNTGLTVPQPTIDINGINNQMQAQKQANVASVSFSAGAASGGGSGIMGAISGGAGGGIGGAVGGALGGVASKLIAGKGPQKFDAYKPTVRKKPLTNIDTNPADNTIAGAASVPTGSLQSTSKQYARYGDRRRALGYTSLSKRG